MAEVVQHSGGPARAAGYRDALRRLAAAQKPAKGAPPYSLYVNRPAGRYLAAAAHQARLTPNQVTAISALCSAAGIAVLAGVRPAPLVGVLVAGLLLLGYALDAADGQLARLQGAASKSGEWLDHMIDSAKICALHLAVLISVYRFAHLHSARYLLVPLGFCVVASVLFFGMTLKDQLRRAHAASTGMRVGAAAGQSRLRTLPLIGVDFGAVCAVFVLLGWRTGFLVAYAALFAAHVGFLAMASVKWFRDIRALDRGRA